MPATRRSKRKAPAAKPADEPPKPPKEQAALAAKKAKKAEEEAQVVPAETEEIKVPKALQPVAAKLGKPVPGMAKSRRVWKTTQTKCAGDEEAIGREDARRLAGTDFCRPCSPDLPLRTAFPGAPRRCSSRSSASRGT